MSTIRLLRVGIAIGLIATAAGSAALSTETPAAADKGPSGCISAPTPPNGSVCPPGAPTIVGAAAHDLSTGPALGVTSNGVVYEQGVGKLPGVDTLQLNAPIVGISSPLGPGPAYSLVGADGGVFTFGGAQFYGSMAGHPLNAPIVGITTLSTDGYWLVASDGGVFAFGAARFFGSMAGRPLNAPIVGIASAGYLGYFLVAKDGGVFAFGSANFRGSMAGTPLNAPVVSLVWDFTYGGYWLVAQDGGVFAFGSTRFNGSFVGELSHPVVGAWSELVNLYFPEDLCIATSNAQVYC